MSRSSVCGQPLLARRACGAAAALASRGLRGAAAGAGCWRDAAPAQRALGAARPRAGAGAGAGTTTGPRSTLVASSSSSSSSTSLMKKSPNALSAMAERTSELPGLTATRPSARAEQARRADERFHTLTKGRPTQPTCANATACTRRD